MSFQRILIHCSAHFVAALALALVLAPPPASADAPDASTSEAFLLNTTLHHPAVLLLDLQEAGTLFVEVAALEDDQGLPAFELRLAFHASASAARGPFEKDVDPWDDDLDGKPRPPGTAPDSSAKTAAGVLPDSALQLVLRNADGVAIAAAQSEGGGSRLRLARALAAGRYFLDVESLSGDDAVYFLTLQQPSRP